MEKLLCELWRIAREARIPVQRFQQIRVENATALCSNLWLTDGVIGTSRSDDLERSKPLWTEGQSELCSPEGALEVASTPSDPGVHMFGFNNGAQRRRCHSIHAFSEFQPRACFATSATARDRPRRPMKPISDLLNLTKAMPRTDPELHERDESKEPDAPVKRFGVISRQQLVQRDGPDAKSGSNNAREAAQSILSESLGMKRLGPRTSFGQILKSGRSKVAPDPIQKVAAPQTNSTRKETPPKKEISIPEVEAPKIESLAPPPEPAPRALPSWKVGLANREQRAAKAAAKEEVQRLNEAITAKTVRLVELDGKGSAIVSIREAMAKAKQAGVDLVEVNGRADPPVCKLVDYKKFKFDAKKKEKERKKQEVEQRREKVVKEVRLSSRTDYRDMEMKARAAKEHLALGYQIRCFVQFKKGDRRAGFGEQLLPEMLELLKDHGTVNKAPRATGGRLEMYLRPLSLADRKRLPEYKREAEKESSKKGGGRVTDSAENENGDESTEDREGESREDEGRNYVEAAEDDTEDSDEGSGERESIGDVTEDRGSEPDSDWEASTLEEEDSDDTEDQEEESPEESDDEPDDERGRLRERLRKRRGGQELEEGEKPMSDLEVSFAALDADSDELGEEAASRARRRKLRESLPRKKRWSDQLRRPMRPKSVLKQRDSDDEDEELEPEHFDGRESGSDGDYDDVEREYKSRKQWDA